MSTAHAAGAGGVITPEVVNSAVTLPQQGGALWVPSQSDIDALAKRFQAMQHLLRAVMKLGRDYGQIPGTKGLVLLKPGAEKLCMLFGFTVTFQALETVQDWERRIFSYRYVCRVLKEGRLVAEAEGLANSWEKKWRYRVFYFEADMTPEEKKSARMEMRKVEGSRRAVWLVESDDVFSQLNTLVKMAQKRALLGAVMLATGSSDFFNHDDDYEPDAQETAAGEGEPKSQGAGPSKTSAGGDFIRMNFKERPAAQITDRIKEAGFRWNKDKFYWEAPHSEARGKLYDELFAQGLLRAPKE